MWPASEAPYCVFLTLAPYRQASRADHFHIDKYGWEAAIALLSTAIFMTCLLRFVDAKYLRCVIVSFG